MKINKIAILGNPIKHTLSPKIHNYWLKQLKINGKYEAIKTPIKDFKKTIEKLSRDRYKGLNLTLPLKEEALKYLSKKDKVVSITGAVNVLIFSNILLDSKFSNLFIKISDDKAEIYSKKSNLEKILRKIHGNVLKILKHEKLVFPFSNSFFPGYGNDFHYFGTIPMLKSKKNCQLMKIVN